MKKIYTILLALAALLAVGCTRELAVERQDGDIHIRIAVDGLETKTAGTPAENAVNSLDVFVYKSDETTVLYHEKVTTPSLAAGGYYEQTTDLAEMGNPTADEVKNAVVYAIANYNGTTPIAGTESLAALKALEVDAAKFATPSPFVMTARGGFASGAGNVTVASLQLQRLAAKVTLKLNLPATCTTAGTDPTFGATTTTWTPMTGGSNFRSILQNAVGNSKLDGSAAASPDVFSYGTQSLTNLSPGVYSSADFYTYPVSWTAGSEDEPFVKVVLSWSYVTTADSDGSEVDRNVVERYYKIVFSGLSELAANTWYQPEVTLKVLPGEGNEPVLVIPEGLQVQPWGLVGGTDPSAAPISNVAVTDAKFISVPTEISVERGTSSSFEVIASGPLTMEIKNISRTRFIRTSNPTSLSEVGIDMDGNGGKQKDYIVYEGKEVFKINETDYDYSSWVDERGFTPLGWVSYSDNGSGGTLSLNHQLSASLNSTDFAVTPYVYEIRLKLNSDNSVFKDVVITQNPAILLENVLSSGHVYINNKNNRVFRADGGSSTRIDVETDYYVYPTALHNSSSTGAAVGAHYANLGYLPSADLKGYSTACKFRFLVDVVPYDEVHSITDTRASITGDFATVFKNTYSGTSIIGGVRRYNMDSSHTPITNTSENQYQKIATTSTIHYVGATEEPLFVSPGFMIASSYGAISGPTYFGQALLRCATYQEDGYPAGRWRLPTESELSFVYELQEKEIMPAVFTADTWVSSGRYYDGAVFQDVKGSARHTVRCVYDTWYYGKDPVVSNTTYTVMVTK